MPRLFYRVYRGEQLQIASRVNKGAAAGTKVCGAVNPAVRRKALRS
jgi:hypothetical protein